MLAKMSATRTPVASFLSHHLFAKVIDILGFVSYTKVISPITMAFGLIIIILNLKKILVY